MSTALKCPNPSCPYLFDPSRVPAGVVLTCPRCGMRFTLGTPAPAAQAPVPGYPPAQQPVTSPTPPTQLGIPPATNPLADDPGPATAPTAPPPASAPEPRPPRQPLPSEGGSSFATTIALVVMALALLGGVGATVYFRMIHKPSRGPAAGSDVVVSEKNLAFDPPPAPWERDDDTKTKLGSPMLFVYKRADPEAYMAFGAKDYDTHDPRPAELRLDQVTPLNRLFEDVVLEPLPDAKWLGRPAAAFAFRGRTKQDGTIVTGQCHAVGYKGVGYWSMCWAGENDTAGQLAAFAAQRDRFKLLGEREKWVGRETPVRAFGGHRLGYEVLDADGVWSEPDRKDVNPTDLDPKADMVLHGRAKRKGVDRPDEAQLLVLILDSDGGDALAQGRKYVEDQRAAAVKEGDPKLVPKFTERTADPEGDATPVDQATPVVRIQAMVPGATSASRLLVVSAIKVGDKVVVASAWCAWGDRGLFETKLAQIAGSLRETK
jgi:hypothetical protein